MLTARSLWVSQGHSADDVEEVRRGGAAEPTPGRDVDARAQLLRPGLVPPGRRMMRECAAATANIGGGIHGFL